MMSGLPLILIVVPGRIEKSPLSITHPELAAQADGWDPTTVTAGSSRKLSWLCTLGHDWETSPKHRSKGTGCPVCAGQKIVIGINDLATTNPELVSEADGWDPSNNLLPFSKKYGWKCKDGHTWEATITSRKRGSGCPSCAGVRLTPGQNDLLSKFPEIAKELIDSDPSTLSVTSKQKVKWQCRNSHIYIAAVGDRTRGQGCGVCAGKQIQADVNDLQTTHPEIASEADGWDPTKVTFGSNKNLTWKCAFGHRWDATPNSRCISKTNCPICGGRKILAGFNDLATKFPSIAAEADGWDPSLVLAGSNRKLGWKCSLGHRWVTQLNIRTSQGTGCPTCSGHQVLSGFNDLASKYPDLALEADGWDPTEISAGSHKKLNWVCDRQHHWTADVHSRASGVGCPICRNKKVLPGFNDLATTHSEVAGQADGWNPALVIAGSNKKLSWKCPEGHTWLASPNKRTSGNRGCPSCASTGYDPNKNGYLYFISHEDWNMLQIGITNDPERRLEQHKKLGWHVLEVRGPMDGHLPQQWERAILRMLKAKGADLANASIFGKFDGYTEAWSRSTFEVSSIQLLMKLTEEFEEGN